MPSPYKLRDKRIFVAGHGGMVGQALCRRLNSEVSEIILAPRSELDLRNQADTHRYLIDQQPDVVFLAAAKVGGILANDTYPATFLYDNLTIAANVIEASRLAGVGKLVFLGSSCIYPRRAQQPINEEALMTGPLEPTNEAYAIAKISGIKLCQMYRRQYGCDFISVQPTNLYGPGDNFDLESSHVLPALLRKAHEAKLCKADSLSVWGSGSPLREFLHVDDLADSVVFLCENYSGEDPVNVGSGEELSIRELAEMICAVIGFEGRFEFDSTKPDGTPRKLLDTSRLRNLGWLPRISLRSGLSQTYQWYLDQLSSADRTKSALAQ